MLRGFFGNLIFAIIARSLCGNHLNLYLLIKKQTNFLSVHSEKKLVLYQYNPYESQYGHKRC